MNDCVWCYIFCECPSKCDRYLSLDGPEGQEMFNLYQTEIDRAIEPIKRKYQERQAAITTQEGGEADG